MSQSAITLAFENYKAQEAINGQVLKLDEFVLANVPGLDPSLPVDRNETVPLVEHIVHCQPVSKEGVVNQHTVAYSITMGSDVGDFDFNWLGLRNKDTGLLGMVVHVPTQRKIATAAGQQGNALTRSFLMEYNGAAEATGITTPAETWQIDFTARLLGIDDAQRLANRDLYGAGAFFGDGFLVTQHGSAYSVTAGVGYIGGLRATLNQNKTVNVVSLPTKVWADVSYQGTVTSDWQSEVSLTPAETMVDYVDAAGFAHYVFAVAAIDSTGAVTDLRPKGSVPEQESQDAINKLNDALAEHEKSRNHPDASLSEKGMVRLSNATDSNVEDVASTSKATKIAMDNANARLAKERNLADLPNPALACQNLGLSESIVLANGALQKNQNGLDIPDKPAFIDNVGLRETVNQATGSLQKNQNGADIPDKTVFVKHIGACCAASSSLSTGSGSWTTAQFIEWLHSVGALDHPYWMCKGSWDYAGNKTITDTGCGNIHLAGAVIEVMGSVGATTIRVTTPSTTSGDGIPNAQFTYINHGDGYYPCWRRDINTRSAGYIDADLSAKSLTSHGNIISNGSLIAFSGDGRHHLASLNQDGTARFYIYKDKGGDLMMNNGSDGGGDFILRKDGGLTLGSSAQVAPNGDVYGTLWGGWLSAWINSFVQSVQYGAEGAVSNNNWGGESPAKAPPGCAVTGFATRSDWNQVWYKPIQVHKNGTWITIAG